jgi:trigger factor
MKANVESRTGNQVTMMVEIEPSELNLALDKAYQKLVKTVNIRGFRKGHVPRPILERFLGKEALLNEALETMFPDVYSQAVDETGIKPVDAPSVENMDITEDNSVMLTIEVTVEPEVVLGEYKGLSVDKKVTLIGEDAVDDALQRLLEQQSQLEIAERDTVQQGDQVTIDYTGYLDGQAFPNGADTDYELVIGSHTFIPGFEEALIGAKRGSDVEFNVTFPENYGSTDLAGKEVTFKVTVHEIKEKVYPELNDEFAKDVSSCDTLADLRAEIRGNLEKQVEETAQSELRDQLVDLAVKNSTIDLPEAMVRSEMEQLTRNFEQRLAYQGMKLDMYLKFYQISREQFDADIRTQAEDRLRASLVLEAIVEKEGITVTSEEVEEKIEEIASRAGNRAENVKTTYANESQREILEHNMRLEKALDLMEETAQITIMEVNPTVDSEQKDNVE